MTAATTPMPAMPLPATMPLAPVAPTAPPAMAIPTATLPGQAAMVQIRNIGPHDFTKEYHTSKVTIPAGTQMIVPWEMMVYWLGNPALADASIRQRDRSREYDRLRVLYGAYEDDTVWNVTRPQLEVYALNGDRIWTVVDDPTGDHVTPAQQSVAVAHTYEAQIAIMQQQIDALQNMMQAQAPMNPALPETPVAPPESHVGDATVPMPPAPMPTQPPFTPPGPPPFNPMPAPPFNPAQGAQVPLVNTGTAVEPPTPEEARAVVAALTDNGGKWVDTTPQRPVMPPFQVDPGEPPEDTAANAARIS